MRRVLWPNGGMNKSSYKRGVMVASLLVLVSMTGCISTSGFMGGRLVKNLVPIEGDPTTLRNITYTATDELAEQMQDSGVNAFTPISVTGLKAISMTGTPAASITTYGPAVQQHVTNRLMQHGFRLGGMTVPPKSRSAAKAGSPVTLGGDYILSGQEVLMHLEAVEDKSGKILASHDYTVPMTPEVQAVMAGRDVPAVPALAVAQKWPDMQAQPVYTAPATAMTPSDVLIPARKPVQ